MKNHLLTGIVALLAAQTIAQTPLSVTAEMTNEICFGQCNGTAMAIASGGVPPYMYLWSPMSVQTAQVNGLCAGTYTVMITDGDGNTAQTELTVEETAVTPEAGVVTFGGGGGCLVDVGAQVTAVATGGTPPFAFFWSTGEVTQTVTLFAAGAYQVVVVDANGCNAAASYSTMMEMQGQITWTGDDPCNGPVTLNAEVTGGTEPYSYQWSTGETEATIEVTGISVVQLTVTDADNCSGTLTAYLPTEESVLTSNVTGWLNRGFCNNLYAQTINHTCTEYVGPVSITIDPDVNVNSTVNPPADSQDGNTFTWNEVTIPLNSSFNFQFQVCVPLSVACTDTVDVTIVADEQSMAHFPWVACSYDPNDKQVAPMGTGEEGFIPAEQELTYTVRFQNTGDAPATFIHIIDTLDADLDLFSLRVLAHSHPMELRITGERILDFFFDNIMLPDSTSDEAGSQGFVVYAINALPGLTPGTELTNTAHIFFDYNDPIITNTTLNTIEHPVGMGEIAGQIGALSIYPNPGTDVFHIRSGIKGEHIIEFLNTMGQRVLSTRSSNGTTVVDTAHLPSGLYTVMLRNSEQTLSGRVVKR